MSKRVFAGGLSLFILLIFCAGFAYGNNARPHQLIFGTVMDEGAVPQEKAASYQIASLAVSYVNTYFQLRNINIRLYEHPQMGSYFDTLDRLQKRKLDIALLPSFSSLAAEKGNEFKLVGILDYPNPWRTALLVRKDSPISDYGELLRDAGSCTMVYVNELSATGYLISKIYFTDQHISFKKERFSEGHLNSIGELLSSSCKDKIVIAIDQNTAEDFMRADPQSASQLKNIYTMSNPNIFKNCIFAGANLDPKTVQYFKEAVDMGNISKIEDPRARNKLRSLADQMRSAYHFNNINTSVDRSVFNRLNSYLSRYNFNFTERFPVDRVLSKISEDVERRSLIEPHYQPKIAVVLSGGGASGAYQAGVLKALNERLIDLNQSERKGKKPLTIDLVVGTSIGALNGLLYSLGNLNWLEYFWSNVRSEDIFTPNWRYQIIIKHAHHPLIMLLIDLFTVFIIFSTIRSIFKSDPRKLGLKKDILPLLVIGIPAATIIFIFKDIAPPIIFMMILMGLGPALIGYLYRLESMIQIKLIAWFSRSTYLNNLAKMAGSVTGLLFTLLIPALLTYLFVADNKMGTVVISINAVILFSYLLVWAVSCKINLNVIRNDYFRAIESFNRLIILAIAFLAVSLSLNFFKTGTAVFTSEGYESICTRILADAIDKPVKIGKYEISRELLSNKVSKQIVITASDITHRQEVYFYFIPHLKQEPVLSADQFWISLNKYPEKLIDVAVATGTVLTFFPLKKIEVNDTRLALIDGGYLHFVPVDAATSLGATHLIIIICTEDTKYDTHPERWNFFQYYNEASDFATYGSQTLDYLGREKRMSFLIAPKVRRILKADFDGSFYQGKLVTLKDLVQEGYDDARGKDNGFRQLSAGDFILK